MKITETVIAPLITAIGFATIYLLCLAIILDDDFMKNYGPDIINGVISGGMTVFAGWLAFREARRANDHDVHSTIAEQLPKTHEHLMTIERTVSSIHKAFEIISIYAAVHSSIKDVNISEYPKEEIFNQTTNVIKAVQELRFLLYVPCAYDFPRCKNLINVAGEFANGLLELLRTSDQKTLTGADIKHYHSEQGEELDDVLENAVIEAVNIMLKNSKVLKESAKHLINP